MERELLLQISTGDKEAFKVIFDTYYKSICLFIQKYIFDEAQSEDIAQEVFIKVWEKKIVFENSLVFRAYLYQSAKNRALNVIEHETVKKRYQKKIILEQSSENFFVQNFIEQETSRLMLKAIDELPPKARQILHLKLAGYKNKEIADQLKISINTVKNHKAFAYKYLKANLKDLALITQLLLVNLN